MAGAFARAASIYARCSRARGIAIIRCAARARCAARRSCCCRSRRCSTDGGRGWAALARTRDNAIAPRSTPRSRRAAPRLRGQQGTTARSRLRAREQARGADDPDLGELHYAASTRPPAAPRASAPGRSRCRARSFGGLSSPSASRAVDQRMPSRATLSRSCRSRSGRGSGIPCSRRTGAQRRACCVMIAFELLAASGPHALTARALAST